MTEDQAAQTAARIDEPVQAARDDVPDGADETGEGPPRTKPRRRRGRRGGRGRGRGTSPRPATEVAAGEGSTDGSPSATGAGTAATAGAAEPVPERSGEADGETRPDADVTPETPAAKRRRRRRGGRGRGKKKPAVHTAEEAAIGPAVEERASTEGEAAPGARRPRRTRARTPATGSEPEPPGAEASEPGSEPERPSRRRARRAKPASEIAAGETAESAGSRSTAGAEPKRRAREPGKKQAEKPAQRSEKKDKQRDKKNEEEAPVSTRLSRSRAGRQPRRRRDLIPVVPRVTDKLMVITEHGERDQIAVLEERDLVQHYVTRAGAKSMVGNVYLGRVQNVLPGMEAAFVDVGRGRNAVLYAGEVNWSPEDLEGAPPRIEHVLKSGQSVLVQVTKDPIGGKGARLTAQISLPGRYLVLAPSSNVTGISRRLPDDERHRLKTIFKRIKPEGHGLIVRTAAEGATEEALAADAERLLATWADIEKRSKRAKAPAVLYEEPELTVRVVRDLFTDEEFRELVTDSSRVYELVTGYLRDIAPDVLEKVRLHQGKLPAFEEFHVVEQIHKGLDRKVWLPSGGYVVIDRTEAMTVVDVNTGKSVGKTNLEETVVNTNVEAAREIARQLRLRDIGGMIIIDFIDMLLEQNKRRVIEAMKEALAQDKSRSQVFDISPLGLLEVTRKRVSGGLLESFSETCPTCEGRGVILTYDVN